MKEQGRLRSNAPRALDARLASRFARIALGHVGREQPNVIAHVAPRTVHPIFHGSFDWHSCVHAHWLLATILRLFPEIDEAPAIRAHFGHAFTARKIAGELRHLEGATRRGFERPYGWAWFLALAAEVGRHESIEAHRWTERLRPLTELFVARFRQYLPKAAHPMRTGTHSNTAFALALAHEHATASRDHDFALLIGSTARRWYARDRGCQAWEPSGEDFLSPALAEAECMRRVLAPRAFSAWFRAFLPDLAKGEPRTLFLPVHVSDRRDGRIVHLDGLNLSRAWCWRSLAAALPEPRRG